MNNAIETRQLDFAFSAEQRILTGVALEVPEGAVYGILGVNGAGKTTLMKVVTGLLKPQRGEVFLLGHPVGTELSVFNALGTLLEGPHLYSHLSGRQNLRVFSVYRGIPDSKVERVLEIVGLQSAADRLVRTYSTGMRQRLGIALALLPDPDLLILDEPTNGLDPQGIAEIRRLIQRLHRNEGKTVFVSSHILSEVEQVCTHVGILHRGQLHFQGTIAALREDFPARRRMALETGESKRAARLLRSRSVPASISEGGWVELEVKSREDINGLIDLLRQNGISIYQLRLREDRLEDYFLKILEASDAPQPTEEAGAEDFKRS